MIGLGTYYYRVWRGKDAEGKSLFTQGSATVQILREVQSKSYEIKLTSFGPDNAAIGTIMIVRKRNVKVKRHLAPLNNRLPYKDDNRDID